MPTASRLPGLPRLILFARSISQPAIIEALHRSLGTARELDFRVTASVGELTKFAIEGDRVVVIANCLLKEDIADLYNALPAFEAKVTEGTLRVLVLNSIRHPRLGPLLRSRSAVEIIELPSTVKALQYKLKNALTIVHQAWQKRETSKRKGELDVAEGGNARASAKAARTSSLEVVWQSGYDFNFDVWWIPSPKNVRNVVGAWLIDMLGPGPVVGVWEEIPNIVRSGERGWQWRPRPASDDVFQTLGGRWIFFGKQPEFSWQKNLWSFVSKTPMLAFFGDGSQEPQYIRFDYRAGEGLVFLENSAHTKSLLSRIQATFESRLGGAGGAPSGTEAQDVDGSFGSWDLPTAEDEGSVSFKPEDDSAAPDWKDHTGAIGAGFRAKDHHIDTRPPEAKPWRNALTPDPKVGGKLGLADIGGSALQAGGKAFDKIQMSAEVFRKNNETIQPPKMLFLYDVNESGAMLLVPRALGSGGDQFHLRIRLDTGQTKLECTMVWEFTSADVDLGTDRLATGVFRSGDFDPLFSLLDTLDARKRELSEFFKSGKG